MESKESKPLLMIEGLETHRASHWLARWERKLFPSSPALSIPGTITLCHGITLLVGASGSGKSVFLSFLAGYPPVDARLSIARFVLAGREMFGDSLPVKAKKVTSHLLKQFEAVPRIFLPQRFPEMISQKLSTQDLMFQVVQGLLGRDVQQCSMRKLRETLHEKLRDGKLSGKKRCEVARLSGGERQRVELLARFAALELMAAKEAFLLLDEPTTGLDLKSAREFYDLLKSLLDKFERDGKRCAVVIATHDLLALEDSCSKPLLVVRKKEQTHGEKSLNITVTHHPSAQAFIGEEISTLGTSHVWEMVYQRLEAKK